MSNFMQPGDDTDPSPWVLLAIVILLSLFAMCVVGAAMGQTTTAEEDFKSELDICHAHTNAAAYGTPLHPVAPGTPILPYEPDFMAMCTGVAARQQAARAAKGTTQTASDLAKLQSLTSGK